MPRLSQPLHFLLTGALAGIAACGGGSTEPPAEPPQVELGQFPPDLTGRLALAAVGGYGTLSDRVSWLHVIDTKSRVDRTVYYALGEEFKNSVAWTPDGTVLFVDAAYRVPNPADFPDCPQPSHFGETEPCYDRDTHWIDAVAGGEVLRRARAGSPAVAPDGRLALVDLPGGGIEVDEVALPLLFPLGGLLDQRLAWAPSGLYMAVTSPATSVQAPGLFLIEIATGTGTRILSGAPDEVISDAAYSPDGTRIAFTWAGGQRNGGEIWTVGPEGGGLAPVTTDFEDGHPAWTADGRYLSFVRQEGGGAPPYGIKFTIYVVPAGGGVPAPVVWSRRVSLGAHAWAP